MRLSILIGFVLMLAWASPAAAQSQSCTSLSVGQSQDITAFSVCRKVTLNSVPAAGASSICVPTNVDAAQWASFYNNPPPGVTIAACSAGCSGGYSYGGYCYFHAGDGVVASCDTVCVNRGGCSLPGTRYIGSDDSSGARCSAVVTGIVGSAVTASPTTGATGDGCFARTLKGGWLGYNMYSPTTNCTDQSNYARVCACGGAGTCAGPYSIPGANRVYSATTLATNTFSISSNATISVGATTGACNPQPTYNHPHYVQVIRVSDGAVLAQGNNGGYTWHGACWTQTASSTSVAVGPGTYTTRLVSQQNCNDSTRCSWGYSASISCY